MIHGLNNKFFIGVVEDRHDPEQMGRVRVRVFSLHNEDRREAIPVESLPWSMVLHSGSTPTAAGNVAQLKEGVWVLVLYLDQNYQESIVLGSLPSRYDERPDYDEGLSDPFGVYPRFLDETSLVAREDEWTKHPTYRQRAEFHTQRIPIAVNANVSTVGGSSSSGGANRDYWGEEPIRGDQESQYPYNAVREFESGTIEEIDSTPDNSRITKMHRSGTYEEILHMGSRTVKIVGNGYHIIINGHNMFVGGSQNITIGGGVNHFITGSYNLEIGGNFSVVVGRNFTAKINGNEMKEVVGTKTTNIGKNDFKRVCEDVKLEILGERETKIHKDDDKEVLGDETYRVEGKREFLSVGESRYEAQSTLFVVGGPDIQLNP